MTHDYPPHASPWHTPTPPDCPCHACTSRSDPGRLSRSRHPGSARLPSSLQVCATQHSPARSDFPSLPVASQAARLSNPPPAVPSRSIPGRHASSGHHRTSHRRLPASPPRAAAQPASTSLPARGAPLALRLPPSSQHAPSPPDFPPLAPPLQTFRRTNPDPLGPLLYVPTFPPYPALPKPLRLPLPTQLAASPRLADYPTPAAAAPLFPTFPAFPPSPHTPPDSPGDMT